MIHILACMPLECEKMGTGLTFDINEIMQMKGERLATNIE